MAITEWSQVPLVCSLETTARVLNTSPASIYRALKLGTMIPQPMPRVAGGKWQWSKKVLQSYIDGGYQTMRVQRRKRAA